MTTAILTEEQLLTRVKSCPYPAKEQYFAFYSSWYGGITKDPAFMLLPLDDHMVHRGDGVFEAMKSVDGAVYLMDEHLERLFISADKIALKVPVKQQQLKSIILDTLRAANQPNTIIRLFISRGPGSFSVNPYDSTAAQLYVAITELHTPTTEKYENGVVVGKSSVIAKSSWMAQVKSCNYLPNVLMKKEAVDRGLDFVIGTDENSHITESATENIMIVAADGTIKYPELDGILKGTTMIRACELATKHGFNVHMCAITLADLLSAQEVMITGTSLNVLPVVKFEDKLISGGKPGPIAKQLNELMRLDIKNGDKITRF